VSQHLATFENKINYQLQELKNEQTNAISSLVTKKDIMKVYDKMETKSNLADFKTFKQEI
jgi:hypothetical protein